MTRVTGAWMALGWVCVYAAPFAAAAEAPVKADICVYGGTAAGCIAATAAAQEGRSVIVVEPSRWLGGMTGGGLHHVDWGNKATVGGLAATFFHNPEDKESEKDRRDRFKEWLQRRHVRVIYEHRLASVEKIGTRIHRIQLEHAPPDRSGCPIAHPLPDPPVFVEAAMFIDCSYEGDLMARSGVGYAWGRESSAQYGEDLAGARPPTFVTKQVDPYVKPGDPSSGLLPTIQSDPLLETGEADRLSMAYCFRFKISADPSSIVPIDPPADYDPALYELAARAVEKGMEAKNPITWRDGNLQRNILLASAPWGENRDYPDGDWPTRSRIWKFHENYARGLMHFLATSPRIPEATRRKMRRVGLDKAEFPDTNGWPHQLYIREARRMVGRYVLTQRDVAGETTVPDSVGLASYGLDDFPYNRAILSDGSIYSAGGDWSIKFIGNKGGVYPIPYRAITPKLEQCENLLVPVCPSASHVAMTSLRMEPVFMNLGQSAASAACQALAEDKAVQDIDIPKLQQRLIDAGQILTWPKQGGRGSSGDP